MERETLARAAVLALALVAGISIRLFKLDSSCLWFDEIFTVHAASQPVNSLLSFVALDLIHPPLFYLILKAWIMIGGEGIVWLRTLPTLIFFASMVPLVLLLKELKQNFNTIILSILVLIFSGTTLKYSLEVRMYSLLLCLALFSMWIFFRTINREGGFAALILVNILLVHTHYFGWLIVGSELIAVLIFDRKRIARHLLAAAVCVAAFLPWFFIVVSSADTGTGLTQNIGWMVRPGIRDLLTFILNAVEPFYFQMSSDQPVSRFAVTVPLITVCSIGVALGISRLRTAEADTRRTLGMVAVLAIVPLIVVFLISWLSPFSIWGTRHLIILLPPLYILVAILYSLIDNRPARTTLASLFGVLITAAGILGFSNDEARPSAWCSVGPIVANTDPDTPVYTTEDLIAYHAWFELGRGGKQKIGKIDGVDGIGENKAYFLPRGFDGVQVAKMTDVNEPRLWLLFRARDLRESEPPLRNMLVKGYSVAERKTIAANGETLGLFLLERR